MLERTLSAEGYDVAGAADGGEALAAVEADYRTASRAARALAEEVFATRVVIPRILAAADVA